MNITEAIKNRRTIRKFEQKPVSKDDLIKLIDLTRYAAYGANLQPLKFAVMDNPDEIYPLTRWANERPLHYIAILGDTSIKKNFETDAGAAITTMMLAAEEMGLATCWLGAIDRDKIKEMLKTDYQVLYLLAVGYPAQKSKIIDIEDGSIKYFEDENGVINVPKRSLDEIIVNI